MKPGQSAVRGSAARTGGENVAAQGAWQVPGATRRPHVCFVAPQAWPVLAGDPAIRMVGGAEVQQSLVARLLAASGYRVSMICHDYGQAPRVEIDGVSVLRTYRPDAGWPGLRFIHPRITGLWRAMREVDADVYYQRAAAMQTALVAAFCRRHDRRSIFAGASDTDFVPGQQPIRFARDRWLFERGLAAVDAVVVQNETQRQACLANYGRSATLIPSYYELPPGARPGTGEYVLWVGTVKPDKRPELFLELARRLPQRRFVMVGGPTRSRAGSDSYFDFIRQSAARLKNVEFMGFLPLAQVEPFFDRARVLVSTSSAEGMPNVFLQAWARGVPALGFSDVGAQWQGVPLYRIPADVDAAAVEVSRLFTDDIHFARSSSRCRDYFAATHGRVGVLRHYQSLFDELVSRGVE